METKTEETKQSNEKFVEKFNQSPERKQDSNTNVKSKRLLSGREPRRSLPSVKFTMIPKLKSEANKTFGNTKQYSVKYTGSCSLERELENEELDEKLRLLEAKEKSIAQYYQKIKELNRKVLELQKGCFPSDYYKAASQKDEKSEVLLRFERSIYQISDIWLKTSTDLVTILKNTLPPNSNEFKVENSKIQLIIKQAKSLTLIKTKDIIAEAYKLLNIKEGIHYSSSEPLANEENCRESHDGPVVEKPLEGGDSKTVINSNSTSSAPSPPPLPPPTTTIIKPFEGWTLSTLLSKVSSGDVAIKKTAELAKKNETITLLNNKIFEFQKACNEHLLENSQLQYKIAEMNEKNQWNQVFWQQISKLKDRIKLLQQNNRQLEAQKKELETKIAELSVEMEKVTRLNHRLRQQINMYYERQASAKAQAKKTEQEVEVASKPSLTNTIVLQNKENIIEELKNMLVLMRGQETFAHQKITEFETKIEEFKKYHN